jgi:hypothetical protein
MTGTETRTESKDTFPVHIGPKQTQFQRFQFRNTDAVFRPINSAGTKPL